MLGQDSAKWWKGATQRERMEWAMGRPRGRCPIHFLTCFKLWKGMIIKGDFLTYCLRLKQDPKYAGFSIVPTTQYALSKPGTQNGPRPAGAWQCGMPLSSLQTPRSEARVGCTFSTAMMDSHSTFFNQDPELFQLLLLPALKSPSSHWHSQFFGPYPYPMELHK